MKEKKIWITVLIFLALWLVTGGPDAKVVLAEEEEKIMVPGTIYGCDSSGNYAFNKAQSISYTKDGAETAGTFFLQGAFVKEDKKDRIPAYGVDGTEVKLYYTYEDGLLTAPRESWHLVSDGGKEINDLKLNEPIQKGMLVLQSSKDGKKWRTEKELSNMFEDVPVQSESFYGTSDIQVNKGTFYRVIVAYRTEIKRGENQRLFVKYSELEFKKTAEVYTFYLYNVNSVNKTPKNDLKKSLGPKFPFNAGLNTGYSNEDEVKQGDPHYGWSLGTFFVGGYTRETQKENGDPVFLKNVGDEVVLYFNLAQDIDALNGDDKVTIQADTDGYDQYFQTQKGYGGRGTLIVRFTDHEGVQHDPQIYTDYLEANASSGADTIVKLFEEGDYEVALDYEIRSLLKVPIVDVGIPTPVDTTNYRIFFRFSVRNGNCMVYPFDVKTGAELGDTSWTKNGFRLDMARSRYLTIDVKRTVVKKSGNTYTEDVRFNRPAKDGDAYTEEGIYTFSVNNLYTGESTVKNIYVGESAVIQALAKNKLTVEELNNLLKDGTTMNEDGSLTKPET